VKTVCLEFEQILTVCPSGNSTYHVHPSTPKSFFEFSLISTYVFVQLLHLSQFHQICRKGRLLFEDLSTISDELEIIWTRHHSQGKLFLFIIQNIEFGDA